jgi:hypothetical protein
LAKQFRLPEESGNERHGDLQDIVRAVKAKGAALPTSTSRGGLRAGG